MKNRIPGLTQKESDYVEVFSNPTSPAFLDSRAAKREAGYCPDSVWKRKVSPRAERAAIQAIILAMAESRAAAHSIAATMSALLDSDFLRVAEPIWKLLITLEAGAAEPVAEEDPPSRIIIRPLVRED